MKGGILAYLFCLVINQLHAQKTVELIKTEQMSSSRKAVYFQENKGQIHDGHYNSRNDVLFMGITPQQQIIITAKGSSHQLKMVHWNKKENTNSLLFHDKIHDEFEFNKTQLYRVDMEWIGANPNPETVRNHPLDGYTNYHNVIYAEDGILEVRDYEEVILKELYPGIDVRFYSLASKSPSFTEIEGFEYDFIIHPGADPSNIRIKISGTEAKLDKKGNLLLETSLGTISESAPIVLQEGKELKSRWKKLSKDIWGFDIEEYDPSLQLIIDPYVRVWGTYFGGSEFDYVSHCDVDNEENITITGYTTSSSNIATIGAYQQELSVEFDVFISKFNPSGIIQWSTYYGGDNFEMGHFCKSDNYGNIYIAGCTNSESNIASNSAHQPNKSEKRDSFIAKFNSFGHRLWGTYYGGEDTECALGCTVYGNHVYICGLTQSKKNISSNEGFQKEIGGSIDAYLTKFNTEGIRIWGTYIGGDRRDIGTSCATDVTGNIYLTGYTTSGYNIATEGTHKPFHTYAFDAFLVKFNPTGGRIWGTYYGGQYNDMPTNCLMDISGNIIISGNTVSDNMIATDNSFQENFGGDQDAFLAKFNPSGHLIWGTYYGGSGTENGVGCSVDNLGNIFLSGCTNSSENISTLGSYQENLVGHFDNFLVKFDSFGQRIWSTYYGAYNNETGGTCAVGRKGNILMVGNTLSLENMATSGTHQNINMGNWDAYIVKFSCNTSYSTIDTLCVEYKAPDEKIYTRSGTYTAIIQNSTGCDSIITIHLTIKNTDVNKASAKTSCGDSVGIASVFFMEGIAPITYHWLPSEIKDSIATGLWSGIHYVTVTDAEGCTKTDTIVIEELKAVEADFKMQIAFQWQNEVPMEVAFFNQTLTNHSGTKTVDYFWSFGDGSTSTEKDPLHVYNDEGTFEVMLISCYAAECCDTIKTTIEVKDSLHVPNVFTPNGDGINDFFFINNPNLSDYTLVIYNRWGQMVFESSNSTESWNGKKFNTGPECEAGTYFFKLSGKRRNGSDIHPNYKKGIISLLR
jgi:gliding motility-associated-like protein